jgi:hypothetical protein
LDSLLIFSQLSSWWIHISTRWFQSLPYSSIWLGGHGHWNIIKVVSCQCTDNRVSLIHPTIHTQYNLCPVEMCDWDGKRHAWRPLVNLPDSECVIDLHWLYSMSFEVRYQRNRKKCMKAGPNIRRFWYNRWVDAF